MKSIVVEPSAFQYNAAEAKDNHPITFCVCVLHRGILI